MKPNVRIICIHHLGPWPLGSQVGIVGKIQHPNDLLLYTLSPPNPLSLGPYFRDRTLRFDTSNTTASTWAFKAAFLWDAGKKKHETNLIVYNHAEYIFLFRSCHIFVPCVSIPPIFDLTDWLYAQSTPSSTQSWWLWIKIPNFQTQLYKKQLSQCYAWIWTWFEHSTSARAGLA